MQVVQKEEWFRSARGEALLDQYRRLGKNTFVLHKEPSASGFSYKPNMMKAGSIVLEPSRRNRHNLRKVESVRVFGDGKDTQSRALLHHKACVTGKVRCDADGLGTLLPDTLIMGSFNFTNRSHRSLESIVVMEESTLASAMLNHLGAILQESEPLRFTALRKASITTFR